MQLQILVMLKALRLAQRSVSMMLVVYQPYLEHLQTVYSQPFGIMSSHFKPTSSVSETSVLLLVICDSLMVPAPSVKIMVVPNICRGLSPCFQQKIPGVQGCSRAITTKG